MWLRWQNFQPYRDVKETIKMATAPKIPKKKDDAKLSEKWMKKLPDGFAETAESKSNDDLKLIILKSQGVISDLEHDMENDAKLKAIKDELADLKGGYMDTLNCEKAKTKMCLFLLRLRGDR